MDSSIENRARFDLVRYANCWEDADVLISALQPTVGKRYLSIASAGDNSLSLLASGAEVVAVDLSPAQLACVELRKISFANLEYEELLRFFGIHECDQRLQTFERLVGHLSSDASAFWNSKREAIRNGFVHAGKFEDYFRKFRTRVLPLVHGRKRVTELMREKSKEDRVQFFDRSWNTWRWRLLFKVFFSRFVMGRLGRDPEFFRYVEGSVAERILSRTRHAITELETHNNPYLNYILNGNFDLALPHYLRPENFDPIRNHLNGLTLYQGSIQSAASQFGESGFDGFNLSDIFEYLAAEISEQIYAQLLSVCRSAARFAYWNMLVPRQRPKRYADQVTHLKQLSDDLFWQDKAWFYSRFVIEETCN